MRLWLLLISFALLLATVALAQQGQPRYPPPNAPSNSTDQPLLQGHMPPDRMPPDHTPGAQGPIDESQASSSAEVEQRILQAWQSQASLSDVKISVTATAGAVALDGVVADERQHQTALRVARLNAGGRRIADHIIVQH